MQLARHGKQVQSEHKNFVLYELTNTDADDNYIPRNNRRKQED